MGGRSSKAKQAAESEGAPPKQSPLDQLTDGTVVTLSSKASGKLLRIHEGQVDGLGEDGEEARFTVHKKESESGLVVTLQNVADAEKYIQISEDKVGGDGTGDELSELKVSGTEEGVAFESVKTSGQFIAVQEDGSVQTATESGPSTLFTPSAVVKEEPEAPAASTPTVVVEDETAVEDEKTVEDKKEEETPQAEAVGES